MIAANSGKDFVLIFNNRTEACLVQMNRDQMGQQKSGKKGGK